MKEYSDAEIKKLDAEYYDLAGAGDLGWKNFAAKINSLKHADKIYFQLKMLDEVTESYGAKNFYYPEKLNSYDKEMRQIIFYTVETLPKEYYFYWCVYYFFKGDKKNLEKSLDKLSFAEVEESNFAADFLDIYKNAYKGFWQKLSARFKECKNFEAENLCNLFEDFYYNCKTDSEKVSALLNYIQENPNTILAKEFLGFVYENMKLWYNAIAIFEQVAEKSCFYYYQDIYFELAWCYGKVKEYSAEEENYRKCLELVPEYPNALNNLGWSLYRQKKFDAAEKIFLQCLEEGRDLPYPANNLVRIYLKTGQILKAKKFIDSGKFKVSNDLTKKVKNYSPKKNSEFETDDAGISENKKFARNAETSKQQFSSEKIMEDEIVSRIEAGEEIFGLKLKIYWRKGDYYGRQYPYSDGKNNGRLDILCEDERGNLYIIELKKDSGYSDAYAQIKNYVDYFEKNRAHGKKVFGILCLNSPPEKLLQAVRQDKRIRLFEYSISYNERF